MHWKWTSDRPGDFQCPGADALVDYLLTEAADQAMILLHDAGDTHRLPAERSSSTCRGPSTRCAPAGFTFGVVAPSPVPSAVNSGSRAAVVPR